MAFPTGWKRRCAMVIQAAQVSSDQSNFPILLNKDNLPTELLGVGPNAALNGGGDIRVTTDKNGLNRIPIEVCECVTSATVASQSAEIWVKITSLSSVTNTTIYIWYGGPSTSTQPVVSDTYGANNVWDSNFQGVWHLSEAWNGDADNFKDSTSKAKHGTRYKAYGSTTVSTAGKWGGKCINFQGATQFNATQGNAIEVNGGTTLNFTSTLTVEYWQQWDSYSGAANVDIWACAKADAGGQDWKLRGLGMSATSSTNPGKIWWNTTAGDTAYMSTSTYARNTWMHQASVITNSSSMAVTFYANGAADGNVAPGGATTGGTRHFTIGEGYPAEYHRGHLDEVRISSTNRSAGWILTTYRTTNAPASFVVKGVTEFAGPRKRHVMYQDPGMI